MSKQGSTDIAKQNNAGSADTNYDHDQGHTAKAQCAPDGSSDFVTAARTADQKLMTKVFFVDDEGREQTRSYDNGYLFYFLAVRITCLADLARTLNRLNRYTPDSPDGSRRHHPRAWKSWRKRGFLLSPTAQLTLLGSDSASP